MRFNHRTTSATAIATLTAMALVAVLLPMCAMALCSPGGMSHMMGGISSLADCEHMYFASDAPSAVLADIMIAFFVAVFALFAASPVFRSTMSRVLVVEAHPPDPPGDPLVGRLRV